MQKLSIAFVLAALICTTRSQHSPVQLDRYNQNIDQFNTQLNRHYSQLARTILEAGRGEVQHVAPDGELRSEASSSLGEHRINYDEPGKGGYWQGWAKGWYAGQKYVGPRGHAEGHTTGGGTYGGGEHAAVGGYGGGEHAGVGSYGGVEHAGGGGYNGGGHQYTGEGAASGGRGYVGGGEGYHQS